MVVGFWSSGSWGCPITLDIYPPDHILSTYLVFVYVVCLCRMAFTYLRIHSLMRLIASSQSSLSPKEVNLTYPSPDGPKPTPGVQTMLAP